MQWNSIILIISVLVIMLSSGFIANYVGWVSGLISISLAAIVLGTWASPRKEAKEAGEMEAIAIVIFGTIFLFIFNLVTAVILWSWSLVLFGIINAILFLMFAMQGLTGNDEIPNRKNFIIALGFIVTGIVFHGEIEPMLISHFILTVLQAREMIWEKTGCNRMTIAITFGAIFIASQIFCLSSSDPYLWAKISIPESVLAAFIGAAAMIISSVGSADLA